MRGLVLALVAVAGVATLVDDRTPRLRVLDAAVTVLAYALVWAFLRRLASPSADLLGVTLGALAALSSAVTPAATLATISVAQARPLRPALAVAGVSTGAHLVLGAWRPVAGLAYGWWALVVVAVHAALLGWGRSARAHSRLVAALRARAEAAEADQHRRVAEARAAERTRIAREMHDVLAHRLSLLATWAGALEYRPDAPPAELARAAGVVRGGVHDALEELRDVIGVLRADDVARTGAAARTDGTTGSEAPAPVCERPVPCACDVWRLVAEARDAGQEVVARVDLDDGVGLEQVPPAAGRTVFRVVQEALTNARRHAPGRAVEVHLQGGRASGLRIEVVNALAEAGVPALVPAGTGTGLVGLRERTDLLGGELEHGVRAGRFHLSVSVPWR